MKFDWKRYLVMIPTGIVFTPIRFVNYLVMDVADWIDGKINKLEYVMGDWYDEDHD